MELPIDQIVVRERTRYEVTKVGSLAHSIRERGLLHPPVVRRDGNEFVLVAGFRRLAALRHLGFDRVPVNVVSTITDELAALMAEGDENTEREPFTPSEAARHAERIEAVFAARAKERQREAGGANPGKPTASSNLDEAPPSERRTDTQVAKAVGMGRTTLAKAREVVAATEDETLPEPVREVAKAAVVEMDRTGKVDPAHQAVQTALAEYVEADPDVQRATLLHNWARLSLQAMRGVFSLKDEVLAGAFEADGWDELDEFREFVNRWFQRMDTHRPERKLKVVNGGRS